MHRRSKIVCKAFLLILIIGLTGCATIVSKSRYSISVKANEPDTIVKVYDEKNVPVTWTKAPGTITVDAHAGMFSSAKYRFVFEKPGFETDESIVKAKMDPCYWINLICLYSAPVGMLLVDPLSGAMWSFDENVTIMGFLRPKGEHQREPARGGVEVDPQEHQDAGPRQEHSARHGRDPACRQVLPRAGGTEGRQCVGDRV